MVLEKAVVLLIIPDNNYRNAKITQEINIRSFYRFLKKLTTVSTEAYFSKSLKK